MTAKDVARLAGVALPTAYEALRGNGRLAAQTEQRVLDAARQLGFRPSSAARSVKTRRTNRIGLIAKNHPVVMEAILGVNAVLQDSGHQLSIFPFDEHNADRIIEQAFRETSFDGMLSIDLINEPIELQLAAETHCVWVNTNQWHDSSCLRRDEHAVGRLVGDALAESGWRRWAFIYGRTPHRREPHFSTADRLAGLRESAAEHDAHVTSLRTHAAPMTRQVLQRQLERVDGWRDGEVALVFSDNYRVRVMLDLLAHERLVPGCDVSFACCDDAKEFEIVWPELSRARFNRQAMGEQAARMLVDQIAAGQPSPSRRLVPQWHLGQTLRPATTGRLHAERPVDLLEEPS